LKSKILFSWNLKDLSCCILENNAKFIEQQLITLMLSLVCYPKFKLIQRLGIGSLVLFLAFLGLVACKKKSVNLVDQLPAISKEGKNTFGCIVNGEVFLAKKRTFSSITPLKSAYSYQHEDIGTAKKGYYFELNASDNTRQPWWNLRIYTAGKSLTVGEFDLEPSAVANAVYGVFSVYPEEDMEVRYGISSANKGKLKVMRFDLINRIVSGTFWFDAVNAKGEKITVRDGRFDVRLL
jgi:hypothetical protein